MSSDGALTGRSLSDHENDEGGGGRRRRESMGSTGSAVPLELDLGGNVIVEFDTEPDEFERTGGATPTQQQQQQPRSPDAPRALESTAQMGGTQQHQQHQQRPPLHNTRPEERQHANEPSAAPHSLLQNIDDEISQRQQNQQNQQQQQQGTPPPASRTHFRPAMPRVVAEAKRQRELAAQEMLWMAPTEGDNSPVYRPNTGPRRHSVGDINALHDDGGDQEMTNTTTHHNRNDRQHQNSNPTQSPSQHHRRSVSLQNQLEQSNNSSNNSGALPAGDGTRRMVVRRSSEQQMFVRTGHGKANVRFDSQQEVMNLTDTIGHGRTASMGGGGGGGGHGRSASMGGAGGGARATTSSSPGISQQQQNNQQQQQQQSGNNNNNQHSRHGHTRSTSGQHHYGHFGGHHRYISGSLEHNQNQQQQNQQRMMQNQTSSTGDYTPEQLAAIEAFSGSYDAHGRRTTSTGGPAGGGGRAPTSTSMGAGSPSPSSSSQHQHPQHNRVPSNAAKFYHRMKVPRSASALTDLSSGWGSMQRLDSAGGAIVIDGSRDAAAGGGGGAGAAGRASTISHATTLSSASTGGGGGGNNVEAGGGAVASYSSTRHRRGRSGRSGGSGKFIAGNNNNNSRTDLAASVSSLGGGSMSSIPGCIAAEQQKQQENQQEQDGEDDGDDAVVYAGFGPRGKIDAPEIDHDTPFKQHTLPSVRPQLTPFWHVMFLLFVIITCIPVGTVLLVHADSNAKRVDVRYDLIQSYRHPPAWNITGGLPDAHASTTFLWQQDIDGTRHRQGRRSFMRFNLTEPLRAPILMSYGLTGFYQNHLNYHQSISYVQNAGKKVTSDLDTANCAPLLHPGELVEDTDDKKGQTVVVLNGSPWKRYSQIVYHPCGAVAWSMFNDTFALWKVADADAVTLPADSGGSNPKSLARLDKATTPTAKLFCNSSDFNHDGTQRLVATTLEANPCTKSRIQFASDRARFKDVDRTNNGGVLWMNTKHVSTGSINTPNIYLKNGWYADEPGHELPFTHEMDFQIWMRTAPLSTFRKLLRIIEHDMDVGQYQLEIDEYYDAVSYGGTKFVSFETRSKFGGRNFGLPILYLVTGSLALVLIVAVVLQAAVCVPATVKGRGLGGLAGGGGSGLAVGESDTVGDDAAAAAAAAAAGNNTPPF